MCDTATRGPAEQLFSYWSGPVTWMERLSVTSARALGYDVTVFSLEPAVLEKAGLGCSVADARTVMGSDAIGRYRSVGVSHMTNHFRLEGIAQSRGTWFDLDMIFIKTLPPEPYLFGLHNDNALNNAILRLPPDSPLLAEYLAMCRQQNVHKPPQWYPWQRRATHAVKSTLRYLAGKPRPYPKFGPRTLTHLVHKHGLAHLAKPPSVFYPVPSDKRAVAQLAQDGFRSVIQPETVCIHLWRGLWPPDQLRQPPAWASSAALLPAS